MLVTCEKLASGLGAPSKGANDAEVGLGNVPLRLWVAETQLSLLGKGDGKRRMELEKTVEVLAREMT